MESYKCRFCLKSFVNGRALGGHMRSHIHKFEEVEEDERPNQLSDATESVVSSSSSENPTMDDDDPKFEAFTSSVVLEDGEIETNVINLTRKRSKRTRKVDSLVTKKVRMSQLESESAASDTTTEEEDLAFCLMMLSRDQWKKKKKKVEEEIEGEGYKKLKSTMKGRYKCETCGKTFKSYQALGGHRASHKKNRVNNKTEEIRETEFDDNVVVVVVAAAEKRIHECPICFRVFASGQALGGHKRSHGIGSLSMNQVHRMESVKERMIDLNLPAPTEEDEVSVMFQ